MRNNEDMECPERKDAQHVKTSAKKKMVNSVKPLNKRERKRSKVRNME